jgi:hypothetical protein
MKKFLLCLFLLTSFSFYSQIRDLKLKCYGNAFDLTEQYYLLTRSYPDEKIVISYHLSLAEATSGANPIVNPENYTATQNTPVIYARINNTGVISTNYFNLDFMPFVVFLQNVSNTTGLGKNDGQALINFYGGELPIDVFLFKNGVMVENQLIGNQAQNLVFSSGLTSGDYVYQIFDGKRCLQTVAFKVTDPDPLTITTAAIGKTITAAATGGTPPYQYAINGSNYQDSNIFTNVKTGTNTVTARDQYGNVATSVIVIAPTPIDAIDKTFSLALNGNTSNNTPSVLTNDLLNGSAVLPSDIYLTTISAPTGFILNPNGTITVAAATASGNYNLTYRICQKSDPTNCDTATVTIMVTKATPILIVTATNKPILCKGETASLTINVTGGQGQYQYSINGGAFTDNNYYSYLPGGVYNIRVLDLVSNFITTTNYTITEPTAVTATSMIEGQIAIITATGGTLPYQYSLDGVNYQASNVFPNLAPGNYIFRARDSQGCGATIPASILPVLTSVAAITKQIDCISNASLMVTTVGGQTPYTYSINGATYQTSNVFNNLLAGSYNIVVKDALNTVANSNTITITPLIPITATFTKINVSCKGGNDGSITINALGGEASFFYSIDNGLTYTRSPVFTNLTPKTYYLTVKDTNNCTYTTIASINEPAISLSMTSVLTKPIDRFSNAIITLTTTGGTSPYTYSIDGIHFVQSNIFENLIAGTYFSYTKDANGCISNSNAITINPIIAPTPIDAINKTFSLALNGNTSNNTPSVLTNDLLNGSAVLPSDIYLTTVSAPTGFILNPNGTITVAAATASGNYNLTYQICQKTDPTNCDTATVTIMVTKATQIADLTSMCNYYDLTRQKQLLIGNLDQNQTVITYHTSFTDATNGINAIANPEYYANPVDNSFIYARMNSAGVISTSSFKLVQTYGPPPIITTSGYTSGLGKNDGFAELTIFNEVPILFVDVTNTTTGARFPVFIYGNVPFQRIPIPNLNLGNYVCQIVDENHCIYTLQFTIADDPLNFTTTVIDKTITVNATGGIPPYSYAIGNGNFNSNNVFSGLTVGTHTISVRDSNNQTLVREVTITEPNVLNATTTSTNVSCYEGNNGSITVTATGGNPPYMYSKDGNNYVENNTFNNLVAKTYTTYVKDTKGIVVSNVSTISQPTTPLSITTAITSITCTNNGSITIAATGGQLPYTYSKDGVNYVSSNTFTISLAGTYALYAKDSNGCVSTSPTTLVQPTPLVITAANTSVRCKANSDGTITLTVTGGSGSYSYSINGGGATQSSNVFTGLVAGTYSITVTDSKDGCSTTTSVTITEPAIFNTTTVIANITCLNNGSITIAATGGQAPYTFSKDGVNYDSTYTFSNLVSGTYALYAKDSNGCVNTNTVTLVQPIPIAITTVHTNVRCEGNSDGSITLNTTGGSGTYTYSINGSATQNNNVFTGLVAGTYSITATDSNSCTASITTTIIEPTALTATTTVANQTITATAIGGTPPYEYSIDNKIFQVSHTFTTLVPGNYTVLVKDQNGCITVNPTIVNPSVPLINGNSTITQNFSQGQTLGDIAVQGENIKWYSNATPTTGKSKTSNETSLPLSTVLVNNTTYYASQTINGIESTKRLAVTVKLGTLGTNDFVIKDFTYYPNPVKNIFTISNTSVIDEVVLISIKGETLLTQKINSLRSEIDLSNFSKGVYFLKVKSGGAEKTVKIIKE